MTYLNVSITLWFHNWNDHLHEQRLAKDFLIGIREDLKQTVATLDTDRVNYQHTLDYYNTIWSQMQANKVDKYYMDSLSGNLTNMVGFAFDNSRYESFKSAQGRLSVPKAIHRSRVSSRIPPFVFRSCGRA